MSAVETRALVKIDTRSLIEKGKSLYQPVTSIIFPSAKVPASLSSIYVPRKNHQ